MAMRYSGVHMGSIAFLQSSMEVLQLVLFAWLLMLGASYYFQWMSITSTTLQGSLGISMLCLVWHKKSAHFLHSIRTTYTRHELLFAELRALTCLACILSSTASKISLGDFSSDIGQLVLQYQTLSFSGKLDLAASLAIVTALLTGDYDICNRIHRRILGISRGLRISGQITGRVCYQLLLEVPIDLEGRDQEKLFHETPKENISSSECPVLDTKVPNDSEVNATTSRSKPPQIKRVASTYRFMHEELRAFGARIRWSSVRYAFGFQQRPFQDLFLVTFQGHGQSYHPNFGIDSYRPLHPQLQFSAKQRSQRSRSPSLSSVVLDIIDHSHGLGIQGVQSPLMGGCRSLSAWSMNDAVPPSYLQLPGIIQGICVKALPDTGSSQNIINANFIRSLSDPVMIHDLQANIDKPLVAPDGQQIPTTGKVLLPWTFKNENYVHDLWFYVVENCSHEIIIGNRFLHDTKTFEKHQGRLEIIRPADRNALPGNLVSEAQEVECLRQLVSGLINGEKMKASLDTGCEANLISLHLALQLNLHIAPLPEDNQEVKFANGRKGSTCGQVEVNWSFADEPDKVVCVRCYVLPQCIHNLIFGVHFVLEEEPWIKHQASLSVETLLTSSDTGVVWLKKQGFWPFGKNSPDPEAVKEREQKEEKQKKMAAALENSHAPHALQHTSYPQLQTPAIPQPVRLTPPVPVSSTSTRPTSLMSGALPVPPQTPVGSASSTIQPGTILPSLSTMNSSSNTFGTGTNTHSSTARSTASTSTSPAP